MTVQQVRQALGKFDLTLSPSVPRDVLDALNYFGHIAIVPGRLDPVHYGDNLLSAARYVGVLRSRDVGDSIRIGGVHVAMWLGDEEGKGEIIESTLSLSASTFANSVRALLPDSVTEGTLHSVPGTLTTDFRWKSPREAISYTCEVFSTGSNPVEWRVNGDASLDAGLVSDLYVTEPTCVIVRKDAGYDLDLTALPGQFGVQRDVEDFTTRVVVLAEGEGETIATGDADLPDIGGTNPYLDLHGNPVKMTRLVSSADTTGANAATVAQLQLGSFAGTRDALQLSTRQYDIRGEFQPGDYVWCYDPDSGLYDTSNEITFRGRRINPIKLRVTETTWPVTTGMTVAYRTQDGTWIDLTDHVEFESGATQVVVGAFARSLTGAGTEPVGTRPAGDTSVPGVPTFITPFQGQTYLDAQGLAKALVVLAWSAPLNTDGSTIIDGDRYEVRYRSTVGFANPETWDEVSSSTWDDLVTWESPLEVLPGEWQPLFTAWDQTTAVIHDLAVGQEYQVQIRAIDRANNMGAWSATTTFIATADDIAPSTPAPPLVAGSRIAIQVIHQLGKSTGGTFNLERDLHHLEVHVGGTSTFTPSDLTLTGKLPANASMIAATTPVVGTFQVEETTERWVRVIAVDVAGNASDPSDAASVTVELIDDAHISDLTVSKVTAGTVSANWLLGASIRTAISGARVELNNEGFQAFNSGGDQTVDVSSEDGSVIITGKFQTEFTGQRVVINPAEGEFGPEIRLHPDNSSAYSYLLAGAEGGTQHLRLDSGVQTISGDDESARALLATETGAELQYVQNGALRGRLVADRDKAALRRGNVLAYVDTTGLNVEGGKGHTAFAYKTTNTNRTSTSLAGDPELFVDLEQFGTYTFELLVIYTSPTADDITMGLTEPSGAFGSWSCFGMGRDVVAADNAGYPIRTELLDINDTIALGGIDSTPLTAQIKGIINTDVAGRLTFRWSKASASGTSTTVHGDSYITAVRRI